MKKEEIVKSLKENIDKLPPHIIQEIEDFIDVLLYKYGYRENDKDKHKFKFDWEGGLSKLKDKYTSVELQPKALDWR